jgi:hypothetical protein
LPLFFTAVPTKVPTAIKTKLALRDAAAQKVLGTLLSAKADYLMTGDKDLLALAGKYPNCHAGGVLAAPRVRSKAGICCHTDSSALKTQEMR